ncbi:hypothetical protein [Rhizorhabdus dicambivorans]|uniref:Tetratricopeptide repeat protein n=1 Tax=Rhizorhabdus dicambivorans TaxID=1850238 RepID=A0A2A4FUQ3_9SPHN|nr:hypothetical protein [Rhizorhabdus dicambivorans]ATE63495.1 hypothetical protein CMV14_02975 [Rhizorhabdus dicambivorans]PCE41450.1 hypothetical protein COO09_15410 [Rhizorhabdus dicambivorans]
MKRPLGHWLLLTVAALLLVAGAGWLYGRYGAPPPPVDRQPSNSGPRSHAVAIDRADAVLTGAEQLARDHPGEWLFQERLANAHIARARLTGGFADYAAAQAALDRGFAVADKGTGPHLTQLALAMAMHRLGLAEQMADAIDQYAVRPEIEDMTELRLVRGDIAFYRGDTAGAHARYAASGADPAAPGIALRRAELAARTGKADEALGLIDGVERAARLPNAQLLADLALRRGAIELRRGDRAAAARHFDRAARLFPGWWLIEAHRAQIDALEGREPKAIAAFGRIARTSASPEAMDALASLYRAGGEAARAKLWADRAGAIWAERYRLFPEAAAGHAAEHELAFGDPRKALAYARADVAARPYGLPRTTLAWALIANNDPQGALAALRPAFASGWVSAESHLAASQALLLLGRADEADRERETALAIDPHAADASAALLWFGH